jgi:oxalate decarboxylase/phosphoglucose isomerase-like protein (cupin superfamily)
VSRTIGQDQVVDEMIMRFKQTVRAGPGTFVMVPIGVPHTFRNPTETPARFLGTFTRRRYQNYFAELSQLFEATASPTPQQKADLMARYHTEVAT